MRMTSMRHAPVPVLMEIPASGKSEQKLPAGLPRPRKKPNNDQPTVPRAREDRQLNQER